MRKNDLIKLLEQIEGNPQIVLWNGYVGDYMNISNKITEVKLVKETAEFIKESLIGQWYHQNNTFDMPPEVLAQIEEQSIQIHKDREWDFPNEYVSDEEFEHWYGKKHLTKHMLSPTMRGKTSYGMGRGDDLEY